MLIRKNNADREIMISGIAGPVNIKKGRNIHKIEINLLILKNIYTLFL